MEALIVRLTATAKALGVPMGSVAMLDALEVATCAFEDGRGVDIACELARTVLVDASVSGQAVKALTAA